MKRLLNITICVLLLLSLTSCGSLGVLFKTDAEIIAEEQEIMKVGFTNSETYVLEEVLTIDELNEWENPYDKYFGKVLYNTLTDNEKIAYKALTYALVNSYEQTVIDKRITLDAANAHKITEYLSLDTPLLEQNILNVYVQNYAAHYFVTSPLGREVEIVQNSCGYFVNNFTKELWDQKMLAVKEAEKIFATLNTGGSEEELAERIYRYVATNIKYVPYNNHLGSYDGYLKPFLYDAIVSKKSHCDGFTNAMALFFIMAGFEQVEKSDTYNVETGHTWNTAKINGKWYNFDGTAGSWIPKKASTMKAGIYFGFGDFLQEDNFDYYPKYPKCETSLYMQPDSFLSGKSSDEIYNAAYKGMKNHNKEWSLIIVDSFNEYKCDLAMQKIANVFHLKIEYYTVDCVNNKTAVFVCKQGYY